jgi:hypothetical protein
MIRSDSHSLCREGRRERAEVGDLARRVTGGESLPIQLRDSAGFAPASPNTLRCNIQDVKKEYHRGHGVSNDLQECKPAV